MTADLKVEDLRKFWARIKHVPRKGCWEWTGGFTTEKGDGRQYPKMWAGGKEVGVRRLSYLIHYGTVPRFVGCSCKNPKCVNPAHLTPERMPGENIGKTYKPTETASDTWVRTTPKLARSIVAMKEKGMSQPAISRKTGVPQNKVCLILQMAAMCKEGKLKGFEKNANAEKSE